MTLRGLFLPSVLVPTLAAGCIVTKDMGEDETESATGTASESSAASMTSMSGDDAASMTSAADDAASMTSASDGDATATGSVSDDDASATSSASDDGVGTTDDGGSDSSATGSGDEADCEATGGTWDMSSCGHYECGMPPVCAAVIPGCDCGPTMNFVEGTGCVEDPACLQATFVCGDIDCTLATEYCEVLHSGIPGPLTYSCNPLPAACVADPTCTCLDDEGITGPGSQCTEPKGGGLQVDFFAP